MPERAAPRCLDGLIQRERDPGSLLPGETAREIQTLCTHLLLGRIEILLHLQVASLERNRCFTPQSMPQRQQRRRAPCQHPLCSSSSSASFSSSTESITLRPVSSTRLKNHPIPLSLPTPTPLSTALCICLSLYLCPNEPPRTTTNNTLNGSYKRKNLESQNAEK